MAELRVVVIGAGMAGILAGIKLLEAGYSQLAIYEKADRPGGTWRENTYPGLTCDVPSHHYTYSFERNPHWSRHLSPGPEIQAYFEHTVDKYQLQNLIRFNCEVVSARFTAESRWELVLGNGSLDYADVVIAATGVLHHPRTPDIPGLDSFEGALFHTARWDHSVALDGARVGVIGTGSTGVQIVSALAGQVASLAHFVRTPQWIMPVENGHYSAAERQAFAGNPELLNEVMATDSVL